jgi:hypothetical protein
MKSLFAAYAMFVVGTYALSTWRGWEMGSAKRGFIPQSVRQQPGGYRSWGFWRGGK